MFDMKSEFGNPKSATLKRSNEATRLNGDSVHRYHSLKIMTVIILLAIVALTGSQHQHQADNRLTIHNSEWENPMELDIRNMHRYCRGACGYGPTDCQENLLCKVIISVTKFEPPCDAEAAEEMCDLKRVKNLYMIAVLRVIPPKVVNNYTSVITRETIPIHDVPTKCEVRPFVAFSFTEEATKHKFTSWKVDRNPANETASARGDIIYVCISEFPHVTTWIRMENSMGDARLNKKDETCIGRREVRKYSFVQIHDTRPYPNRGVAVMWSKISTRLEQFTMGCKVVISNVTSDLKFTLPGENGMKDEAKFFQFTDVSFKIATGFAYLRNDEIERVVIRKKKKAAFILQGMTDDASIFVLPSVIKGWENSQKLVSLSPEQNARIAEIAEANDEARLEFDRVHRMCAKKLAICYFLHDEENCIHKSSCHFLIAIQASQDFKKLTFYIMFQPLMFDGQKQIVQPQGYAAIGFSNDTFMGKDLVLLCIVQGDDHAAYLTHNIVQNNEINEEEDYLGDPPKFNDSAYYLSMDTETVMCVAELETDNIVLRSFTNAPPDTDVNDKDTWPQYHFYLRTHEYYILLAQGTRISGESKITYHSYRKVSETLFSQERYYEYINNGIRFESSLTQILGISLIVAIGRMDLN